MLWLRRSVALAAVAAALLAACSPDRLEDSLDARYSVVITGFDPDWKIRAIKAVRAETGLGLADAKRLVEETPSTTKSDLVRPEAEAVVARLRAEWLTVELAPE